MRLRAFGDEGRTYRRSTCEVWKINLPLMPPIIAMRAISSRTLSASPDRRQPADAALPAGMGCGVAAVLRRPARVVIVSALYYPRLSLRLGVMMLALLLLCPSGRRLGGVAVDGGVAERRHRRLRHRLAVFSLSGISGRDENRRLWTTTGPDHRPAIRAGGSLLPAGGLRELQRNIEMRSGKVRNGRA